MNGMTAERTNTEPNRRRFLKWCTTIFGSLWALIVGVPGLGLLLTPITKGSSRSEQWIDLDQPADLSADRPVRRDFSLNVEDGWMHREASGFVYAVQGEHGPVVFSPVCTHLGCKVSWFEGKKRFVCPCHGGQYDLEGRVVAGPPPAPLNRLPVRIVDDQVQVEVGRLV